MDITRECRRLFVWGEEGKKLFTFQRSVCQSSSLALHAEKKLSEWKFSEKKAAAQLHNAVAVVLRKNSLLNRHRAKLTFTVC